MGLLDRLGLRGREGGNEKSKVTVEDSAALIRLAEQDEKVDTILEEYIGSKENLTNQVQMGGGSFSQADLNRLSVLNRTAALGLQELGYEVDPNVFSNLE